jgi:3-isopropylmalate dehydrogenase
MNERKIAVMAGDGIGPEVMQSALQVLAAVEKLGKTKFATTNCLVGGAAYEALGEHLPQKSIDDARRCDAILFGSVGGPVDQAHLPKWKNCERNSILALRKAFEFNINLRPVRIIPDLAHVSPLKPELARDQTIDFIIVRELVGGLYFGEHKTWIDASGKRCASDQALYCEDQIAPVLHEAFQIADQRRKELCLVHKANVLDVSRLWQEIGKDIAKEYPQVHYQEMLVDNCAMQLVLSPHKFDVVVTSNLFGDILSDLAAALPGSLGLTPSASRNNAQFGLYEPSGGSAPDIAGKGLANPLAQILSLALLLELQFDMRTEADLIREACRRTLASGIMTKDLSPQAYATTQEFTDALLREIER